jgi:tRNA threonylcarbamoyladenosine biosynthesis protein TsaB
MLILAADTSGKQGSIALAEGGVEAGFALIEVVAIAGGAFSAQLVPQIAALLRQHGYGKSDLDAFAVVNGPGSFTGLRVGLAAIKALAEALQKPIAAISLLEAVACSGSARGRVLAALDAGRGELYVGDYELDPALRTHFHIPVHMNSERLQTGKQVLAEAELLENKRKTFVTPDAALAEMVRPSGLRVERIEHPNSGVIARLGWEHVQRGRTVRPEDLQANYIRQSDAEIFSQPAPILPHVRSAALNDVPGILAIERQAPNAAHWTPDEYNRSVEGGVVLVAEISGHVCGFVCANAVAGEWEIENIVVAGEFLRRGVANQLMRGLIQRAQGGLASAILLEVRESNVAARRLYRKCGFQDVGRRRSYYSQPPEDSILYALRFDR